MRPDILKCLALASVSTLALVSAAQAQQPVHNWTGFYLGVNAGAGWGHSESATSIPCSGTTVPPAYFCMAGFPGEAALVAGAGTGSISGAGFTGGVQAGYNWQANNLILGVEVDFGAFDVGGSRTAGGVYLGGFVPTATRPFAITSAIDTDWLFTGRLRAGWAVGNLLIFATGGLAVTNIETSHTFIDASFLGGATGAWGSSTTKAGWTLGAGLEWAFARNWSVKAEYLYMDFGSVTATGVVTAPSGLPTSYAHAISTSTDLTAHIARAGVNFRF